mmetsp:Transcript_39567/g.93173  ORF Transcript_39567/g.93173 Transcript_39567/m.93173 type:complete len:207 (-) Transcript_39567:70-690(-)
MAEHYEASALASIWVQPLQSLGHQGKWHPMGRVLKPSHIQNQDGIRLCMVRGNRRVMTITCLAEFLAGVRHNKNSSMWSSSTIEYSTSEYIISDIISTYRIHDDAIASSQADELGKSDAFLLHHFQWFTAGQHRLRVPSPRTFPTSSWIDTQGIQAHDQSAQPTECRFILCMELFQKLESSLSCSIQERFLEQCSARRRRERHCRG